MYGYILKKINLIIPLLIMCFLFTAECSFAAPSQKAPVQQKATNDTTPITTNSTNDKKVADSQTAQTTEGNQEDDLFSEDKKAAPAANQQPETPQNPIQAFLAQNNLQMWHLYLACGLLIVIVIIIIATMGGKKGTKYICSKCGAKVLPGNDLCEACKNQEMMLQMENNMGQIQQTQPNVNQQNSFDMGGNVANSSMGNTQTPIIQQAPINPPPVASPPPPPQPMPKKQIPTGRVVAQISIRKGANNGHRFKYYDSQSQVTIGTDKECDFQLEDEAAEDDRLPKIASRHAMITLENGSIFTIHDMSTTGMFVNNNPVQQQQLKTGDVIKIGTTELTFARL